MGDGINTPFTREDVEAKIKEHGGPKGLDLSGKVFEEGIDLRELNLKGIILDKAIFLAHPNGEKWVGAHLEGAHLMDAHLDGVSLQYAHLERAYLNDAHLEAAILVNANLNDAFLPCAYLKGSILWHAYLERAYLAQANLDGADFRYAHLKEANLGEVIFSDNTRLEEVDWGNYILEREMEGILDSAAATYLQLKTWYIKHGIYDVAGEFFFREMTVKRKSLKWWPNPLPRAWSKFISLICGYGERPLRVIGWAASVMFSLAFIYFFIGSVWEWWAFWNSLYFSTVSFTALGYGSWVNTTNDWIRGIGAFESFVGVFSIALFLVTFTRKMTR